MKNVLKIQLILIIFASLIVAGCTDSNDSVQEINVPEPAPQIDESAPKIDEPKAGLTQEHLEQIGNILADSGFSNKLEAEGSVLFVSLYDDTLSWYEIETITRSLTKYVYNIAADTIGKLRNYCKSSLYINLTLRLSARGQWLK